MLIPWYMGERTPDVPMASPVYFGFGLDDFTKEKLCRAVLEGHILNLYDGFQKMPVKPKEIRLTGGLAQSDAWRQTIADVFNAEAVPVEGEGAALGAALHAAWVYSKQIGQPKPLTEMSAPFVILNNKKRNKPVPEHVNIYKQTKGHVSCPECACERTANPAWTPLRHAWRCWRISRYFIFHTKHTKKE